jgi:hypothetical protein
MLSHFSEQVRCSAVNMGPEDKLKGSYPVKLKRKLTPTYYMALFEELNLQFRKGAPNTAISNVVLDILPLLDNKDVTRETLLLSNQIFAVAVMAHIKGFDQILVKLLQTFSMTELDEIVSKSSFPEGHTGGKGNPNSLIQLIFNPSHSYETPIFETVCECYPTQRQRILSLIPYESKIALIRLINNRELWRCSASNILLGTNKPLSDEFKKRLEVHYSTEVLGNDAVAAHSADVLIRAAVTLSTLAFYWRNEELLTYLMTKPECYARFQEVIQPPNGTKLLNYLLLGIYKLPPEKDELAIEILEKLQLISLIHLPQENGWQKNKSSHSILVHLWHKENISGKLKEYIDEKLLKRRCSIQSIKDDFSNADLLLLNNMFWGYNSLNAVELANLKIDTFILEKYPLIPIACSTLEVNPRALDIVCQLYLNAKVAFPRGETPLHYANLIGNPRVIEELLADPNLLQSLNTQETVGKNTPLHCLLSKQRLNAELLLALLGAKPNLTIRNSNGISPLDIMGDKTNKHYTTIRQVLQRLDQDYVRYQSAVISLSEQVVLPPELRAKILSYCFPYKTNRQLMADQQSILTAWRIRSKARVIEVKATDEEMPDVGQCRKRKALE